MEGLALTTLNKLKKEVNDIHSDPYDLCSRAALSSKSVDEQLQFADGKEVNFAQELAQFEFPTALKRNRDILWAKESDAKERGLELYADAMCYYLPDIKGASKARADAVKRIAHHTLAPGARRSKYKKLQHILC